MKLYIDTSSSEKIVIGLDGELFEEDARREKAQLLLKSIDEKLKQKKSGLRDLTDIEVNSGPGSFTGLRVGVSVANALGWSLGIPVNGNNVSKEGPVEPIYEGRK